MAALADAGIYLALDVNSPDYSINRYDPAPSYNDVYLQSVFATIDAFAKYDNTLLFFSGNEVSLVLSRFLIGCILIFWIGHQLRQYH